MEEAREFAALVMPVWLRYKGWRFHVYIGDTTLRPHIHIAKPGQDLKVWLDDFNVAENNNVKPKEERELVRHTKDNADYLMEKWHEQFPDRK